MKQAILIYLLTSLFLTVHSQVASTSKSLEVTGIYECNYLQTKVKHYIILKTVNNKTVGEYIGFEPMPTDTIYYSATIDSLKINGQQMQFQLKDYQFSPTPINFKEDKPSTANQNETKKGFVKIKQSTSFLELYQYSFFGTLSSKTIRLQRISVLYDSRSDEMIFNKTSTRSFK
jgi:hypothetical protein